jgi:hypothetical protein
MTERPNMDINTDKIDEAVLALLFLTLHDGFRAWKSFDWKAMNRLHEKGWIEDPVNKTKSVALTPVGVDEAKRLFQELFCHS